MRNIKQGDVFPPTAKGTGYLALIICGILFYYWGTDIFKLIPIYILIFFFLILQLAKKLVNIFPETGSYQNVYKFLFFKIKKDRSLSEFKYLILKQINQTYRVQQAAAIGLSIQEGIYKESFCAIVGKNKKNNEQEIILKGKKQELIMILKKYSDINITVYSGAPKAGYELHL